MSAAIEVEALWADYGGAPVLKGVSLSVPAGDFLGILGPNACGKSTLVRVLSGVLKPSRGSARVAGLDPASASPRDLAGVVATVPQSVDFPFPFTGREVVAMGRYPRLGRFAAQGAGDVDAVRRALEETDTVALADRYVTELSGGERQRLLLARALAQETPVLLLDEATAAMDVHRKIDAFDLLARYNAAGGTVVAVMHDLNLASLYCRRLLLLRDGEVRGLGATAEVFTKDALEAVYGTPLEVGVHAATSRPYALFLPGGRTP